MKLTMSERFTVQQLLPQQANLATMRIVQALRMELAPTEEEITILRIREHQGQVRWDVVVTDDDGQPVLDGDGKPIPLDVPQEIPFGPMGTKLVVDALQLLDADGKLTAELLPLCDKFLDPPAEEPAAAD